MPATNVQVIGAAPEIIGVLTGARQALVFQVPAGGGNMRWGFGADVSATVGILVSAGDPPVALTSGERDSLAAQPVYGHRVTVDVSLQVAEA